MHQKQIADLQALLDVTGKPCVSMYLPTGAKDQNLDQGRIRLKNMLRTAHAQLKEMGARETDGIGKNLRKAEHMADTNAFWSNSGRGMAVFISDETFGRYSTREEMKEIVVVSERFHLKPLLPLLSNDIDFYLLKISRKTPRLYRVARNELREIEVANMPTGMAEVLNERDLTGIKHQHGASPSTPVGGPGYHGHSSSDDAEKEKYSRYLRILDQIVQPILVEERRPLLLIGGPYERAAYRDITSYDRVFEEGVSGNADDMTIDELHERALKAFEPHLTKKRNNAIARFNETKAHGRGSNDLVKVAAAAVQGRVDSLFVGRGVQCWGKYDPDAAEATWHEERQAGDVDLLDLAAVSTRRNKGTVYLFAPDKVPGSTPDCPVAAIFRF